MKSLLYLSIVISIFLLSCNKPNCYFKNEEDFMSFQKVDTLVQEYYFKHLIKSDSINLVDLRTVLLNEYPILQKHLDSVKIHFLDPVTFPTTFHIKYGKGNPKYYYYSDTGANLDVQDCIIHNTFHQNITPNDTDFGNYLVFVNTDTNWVHKYVPNEIEMDLIDSIFYKSNLKYNDTFLGKLIFDKKEYRVIQGDSLLDYHQIVNDLRKVVYNGNMKDSEILYLQFDILRNKTN